MELKGASDLLRVRASIADPLPISPARLPVRAGLEPPGKILDEFQGLHGAFNDSLPDGWGRLLLDRRLLKLGVQPEHLTPLDRLSAVGATGMGALVFKPRAPHEKPGPNDLDWFIEQVERVQNELRRTQMVGFFQKLSPTLVGIEAVAARIIASQMVGATCSPFSNGGCYAERPSIPFLFAINKIGQAVLNLLDARARTAPVGRPRIEQTPR